MQTIHLFTKCLETRLIPAFSGVSCEYFFVSDVFIIYHKLWQHHSKLRISSKFELISWYCILILLHSHSHKIWYLKRKREHTHTQTYHICIQKHHKICQNQVDLEHWYHNWHMLQFTFLFLARVCWVTVKKWIFVIQRLWVWTHVDQAKAQGIQCLSSVGDLYTLSSILLWSY